MEFLFVIIFYYHRIYDVIIIINHNYYHHFRMLDTFVKVDVFVKMFVTIVSYLLNNWSKIRFYWFKIRHLKLYLQCNATYLTVWLVAVQTSAPLAPLVITWAKMASARVGLSFGMCCYKCNIILFITIIYVIINTIINIIILTVIVLLIYY